MSNIFNQDRNTGLKLLFGEQDRAIQKITKKTRRKLNKAQQKDKDLDALYFTACMLPTTAMRVSIFEEPKKVEPVKLQDCTIEKIERKGKKRIITLKRKDK